MKIALKIHPWAHQAGAIRFALNRPGTLWDMGMGTGKSLCAIAMIGATREKSRTLILCPKTVLDVWPGEFRKHAGFAYELDVKRDSADRRAKRIDQLHESCDARLIVAVNYESAITDKLAKELVSHKWDLIVLDESHRAKSAKGKTAKLVWALGERAERRLALSGTPTPHSPLDIFAQARFVDPSVFGTSWSRFCARYAQTAPIPPQWIGRELKPNEKPPTRIVGVRNLGEIERLAASFTYKVESSVLDLPECHHVIRLVELQPTSELIYREIEETCFALVHDAAGNKAAINANGALHQMLRLQAITGGQVTDDDKNVRRVGTEKLDVLVDIFSDIAPNEPIVVFARFHTELAQIHEAAKLAKRESLELSGVQNDYLAWKGGAATVLAVQIQAGGTGIDLTRAAICIYWSKDWSLGNYQQSLARTYRPGQTRKVTYIHLIAQIQGSETIDGELHDALDRRADFIDSFLQRVAKHREQLECKTQK